MQRLDVFAQLQIDVCSALECFGVGFVELNHLVELFLGFVVKLALDVVLDAPPQILFFQDEVLMVLLLFVH